MFEPNNTYPNITPFQRGDQTHINFNYVWDSGLSTWRPLMPSDYGDVTLSNSSVTTNVYQSQERVGITGSDGVIIGVGGAFPVTDNGGSLTVDFDRPVPVTDNDGSLTVDGLIGITGQPIHTTGTIKLDEPIEIYGDVRAAQSGDWFVAITGQPVWVTGNFAIPHDEFINNLKTKK